MMDRPGGAVRDDEPASGTEPEAGSVVFGVDCSVDRDVYNRATADIGALFGLGRPYDPAPALPFGPGDVMRWTPPPEGEETPSCPA